MNSLNIIGAGRVGKVLGALFVANNVFRIQHVCNKHLVSAEQSVQFIGQGDAINDISRLQTADAILLAVPDDCLDVLVQQLVDEDIIKPGMFIWHCSGALSSAVLLPLKQCGALIASVHPILSFSDLESIKQHFAGSYCSVEGDEQALAYLISCYEAIGANTVTIDAKHKQAYHAAAVFVSNYLVTCIHQGIRIFEQIGIERSTAMAMLEPLVNATIKQILSQGCHKALTGPVQRGDINTVEREIKALESHADNAELYKCLAKYTAQLAAENACNSEAFLQQFESLNER